MVESKVYFRKIIRARVMNLSLDIDQEKHTGILVDDLFYDVSKDFSELLKEAIDKLPTCLNEIGQAVIDKKSKKVTHYIISQEDLERIPYILKGGKKAW